MRAEKPRPKLRGTCDVAMSRSLVAAGRETLSQRAFGTVVKRPVGSFESVAHKASAWTWPLCRGLKDRASPEERSGLVYEIPCKDCANFEEMHLLVGEKSSRT